MSKRVSEENSTSNLCLIEDGVIPSTSSGVSEPKRSRMDYNFWGNNGEDGKCSSEVKILKINELSVGKVSGKLLKIRICYVSEIRKTKIGDIVSFHGIDETGEVSIIIFGSSCQYIADFIKINRLYSILHFSVNEENSSYPSGSGNKLQIKLNSDSEVEELDDDHNFQAIFFKFVALADVQNVDKNEKIDVIGVIVNNFGLDKNWKGTPMRELAITDSSKAMVILTLWNLHAENFKGEKFSVVVVRRGIVTNYEGKKKLNCVSGTLVWVNPDIPEAFTTKTNFDEIYSKTK